jgi:zinc transport system substrate-binding protein
MKKYLFLAIFAVSVLFSGCMMSYVKVEDSELKVVSTIFASYDFSKEIAGEYGEVTMLLKPGAEAHSYEPTPKDIVAIEECDVFIYVGGENDAWVDNILKSVDTSDMVIIKMLDLVEKYEENHEGHEHEVNEDHSEWDEHVWTSPKNAVIICEAITEAFCQVNPVREKDYNDNLISYTEKLNALDEAFRNAVENGNRNTLIFGDRFPLRYFIEEYDLQYYAAFSGCSTDTEASPSTIAFLIDKVKEEKIPVILKIELSSDNIARTIAEDSGAKVLTFNTCHNVTAKDFESGATYISLMEQNLEVLKEALK